MKPAANPTTESQLDLLRAALSGSRGEDQQAIAEASLGWVTTLLRKNYDYWSSAWSEPVLVPGLDAKTAILVRMSDKVSRLRTISRSNPEVAESFRDTISDLGAYALLYLAAPTDRPKPSGFSVPSSSEGED